MICHSCRREFPTPERPGRRDECPFCSADVQCCLNCRFHDRAAPKQCREPVAELVKEKGKANYCDHIAYSSTAGSGAEPSSSQAEQARKALDDLFRS